MRRGPWGGLLLGFLLWGRLAAAQTEEPHPDPAAEIVPAIAVEKLIESF